ITPSLVRDHVTGAHVANSAAPQVGHTGDIGGVPLVQPPPPGSPPGSTCGRVVTPLATAGVSWWTSNDCGAHFSAETQITPSTSGATAHLGLYFYSFPVASCAYADPANPSNQCDLRVGFVSSTDGGAHWSDPTYLAHMTLNDLVRSSQGLMVGDYSSADVIPS